MRQGLLPNTIGKAAGGRAPFLNDLSRVFSSWLCYALLQRGSPAVAQTHSKAVLREQLSPIEQLDSLERYPLEMYDYNYLNDSLESENEGFLHKLHTIQLHMQELVDRLKNDDKLSQEEFEILNKYLNLLSLFGNPDSEKEAAKINQELVASLSSMGSPKESQKNLARVLSNYGAGLTVDYTSALQLTKAKEVLEQSLQSRASLGMGSLFPRINLSNVCIVLAQKETHDDKKMEYVDQGLTCLMQCDTSEIGGDEFMFWNNFSVLVRLRYSCHPESSYAFVADFLQQFDIQDEDEMRAFFQGKIVLLLPAGGDSTRLSLMVQQIVLGNSTSYSLESTSMITLQEASYIKNFKEIFINLRQVALQNNDKELAERVGLLLDAWYDLKERVEATINLTSELLETENKRLEQQKNNLLFAGCGIILLIVTSFALLYAHYRKKKEKELEEKNKQLLHLRKTDETIEWFENHVYSAIVVKVYGILEFFIQILPSNVDQKNTIDFLAEKGSRLMSLAKTILHMLDLLSHLSKGDQEEKPILIDKGFYDKLISKLPTSEGVVFNHQVSTGDFYINSYATLLGGGNDMFEATILLLVQNALDKQATQINISLNCSSSCVTVTIEDNNIYGFSGEYLDGSGVKLTQYVYDNRKDYLGKINKNIDTNQVLNSYSGNNYATYTQLGLPLVIQYVITYMKGTIDIVSKPGSTVVRFSLPLLSPPSPQ